jgi:hypothetical protein
LLSDDGLAEPQQECARELAAIIVTARATTIGEPMLQDIDTKLALLSRSIARRYFLQGAEPLRAAGMTLA